MKAKILKSENISSTAMPVGRQAKLFSLEVVSGDFSFIPGQYTSFKANGAIRAYSICSLPQELPKFEFCVRQVPGGVGTRFLNDHVGHEIELTEPTGDFVMDPRLRGDEQIIFIAAGVGIAPVRPMLKDFLAKNPETRVELIYKFHNEAEYLFREELEEMRKRNENLTLVTSLSAAADISPRQGREVFLVGPPGFVSGMLNQLRDLGYNRRVIKTDIWE